MQSRHTHSGAQFLICDDCGKVIESIYMKFQNFKKVQKSTFKPLRWNLEVNGICNQCS